MKFPNGYGGIVKLSGKRRNPYCIRKTIGYEITKDGKTKQKLSPIGYYPTKKAALLALISFNQDKTEKIKEYPTFEDVYQSWAKKHFPTISKSAIRKWNSAYHYCFPLYQRAFQKIKVENLEETITKANVGIPTKVRMKSLFNMLYKYALKYEIVNKNYAELCDNVKSGEKKIQREPFTDKEIKTLFENINYPFVDMILIGIYTGLRPKELCDLKNKDIDLKQKLLKGGSKTQAGKNRIIPIHPAIYQLIKNRYRTQNEYLFTDHNTKSFIPYLSYDSYRNRFNKVIKHFGLTHKPHDTRHTFITKAKFYQMDEYILKKIVGHSIHDLTENVYTHRSTEEFRKEIEKIK